jgi:hypothetical protein
MLKYLTNNQNYVNYPQLKNNTIKFSHKVESKLKTLTEKSGFLESIKKPEDTNKRNTTYLGH